MPPTWIEARTAAARARLSEARIERMQFERMMSVEDSNDALILSALMATESALAHELGMLILRSRNARESAA
jgi:hypothetical protein